MATFLFRLSVPTVGNPLFLEKRSMSLVSDLGQNLLSRFVDEGIHYTF